VSLRPSDTRLESLEAVTAELQWGPLHFLAKTIESDPDGAHVCL